MRRSAGSVQKTTERRARRPPPSDSLLLINSTHPYHITSHHITSHHITSHHITSHHITSQSLKSMNNIYRSRVRRTKPRHYAHFILLLVSAILSLTLMYHDLRIAKKMFIRPSLTQTTIDTELKDLAPILGGHDLSPPGGDAQIILKPGLGKHRYDEDAVFAIGNTLDYDEVVLFVTTLRESGFEGDLVLSTPTIATMDKKLVDFLEYHAQAGLVVYDGVIRLDSTDDDMSHGANVTADFVYLRGLYGDKDTGDDLNDGRIPRSLGVARFELYWVWAMRYSPVSRILLVDAEDTYFQPSGEEGIGSGKVCPNETNSFIHIYEENKLNYKHRMNFIHKKAMLIHAYKNKVIMTFFYNENILTPASTHGHQKAVETYLRAMVKQFDYTQCAEYQCEWAFHNYLFYMGVLLSTPEIDDVKLHMQGTGAVNSIRLDAPLENSKIFDTESNIVYNHPLGDGRQASWAVHQYKSDEQLYRHINSTKLELVSKLDYSKPPLQVKSPIYLGSEFTVSVKPALGQHRYNEDAIFSVVQAEGLQKLAVFILSARKSGFKGDIVLLTPSHLLPPAIENFLNRQAKHDVIVYRGIATRSEKGSGWVLNDFYNNASTGKRIVDPRPPRPEGLVRFE